MCVCVCVCVCRFFLMEAEQQIPFTVFLPTTAFVLKSKSIIRGFVI